MVLHNDLSPLELQLDRLAPHPLMSCIGHFVAKATFLRLLQVLEPSVPAVVDDVTRKRFGPVKNRNVAQLLTHCPLSLLAIEDSRASAGSGHQFAAPPCLRSITRKSAAAVSFKFSGNLWI